MASGPITSWQIDGEKMETVRDFIFGGSRITADGDCSYETKRRLLLGKRGMTNLDSILKSRDISLSTKVHLVKAMVFQLYVWMWELDYKESWVLKNWCIWTVVLEKILESRLVRKEIQPLHPKGNQSWISIEVFLVKFQYLDHLMWESTHWERPWWWERLKAKEKGAAKNKTVS